MLHRRRMWMVHSYSPGCAGPTSTPSSTPQSVYSLYLYIDRRTCLKPATFHPQNCLVSWASGCPSRPIYTYLVPSGLPESTYQTASQSVQLFCRAHDRDRPTARQTHSPTGRRTTLLGCNSSSHLRT